ncbi:MAG: alanine--glyoxylate aminotransferase family protein [Chloroflexi bacterium]|nr:alanine--glyoxylate aminotransferase family protein [Chloroflexota bacterium]
MQLRIPGPTPCPDEVLRAMTKQMINHRGKEFGDLITKSTEQLKKVFQTKGDVLILTASGTGGLEAAAVNVLSPNDKVLGVSIGAFGDRFADIAQQFGANVKRLTFEWGTAADPEAIRQALKADPSVKAVLVTHNETSTGVTNDLGAISKVVREFGPLLVVDGISSVGSINLPVDEWQCDVVITGSQKGWMAPPGLSMISMSQKAWQAFEKAKMPRFYWDLGKARKFLEEKKQTPWTPAVSVMYALAVGLDIMEKETLAGVFARHARAGKAIREGVKSLGLSLLADEAHASNTVTAIKGPAGVDVKKLLQTLREEHKVVLSGGQGRLDGKIFRIGHLGWVDEADMKEVVAALKGVLAKVPER